MVKTAVLLTVYNRKEITLQGLRSLYSAIAVLGDRYNFDIYMTNDGCTDGTVEAVANEFPNIFIIQGNGCLFWAGGMRKAWQAAIDSGIRYDYYLWFNDDAELYKDALVTMFYSTERAGNDAIISGAFCDEKGNTTYGGWSKKYQLIEPNGDLQSISLMNGNLVLIPSYIANEIGIIDKIFKHSLGDWDYGLRAVKNGFKVMLTNKFVGITERHDINDNECFSQEYSFCQRWKRLHSAKFSPKAVFVYNFRYNGLLIAILCWFRPYVYVLFPIIYSLRHRK